jgi:hypothetical protein
MRYISNLIYLYRTILTTNPLKIRCEIESKSQGWWILICHEPVAEDSIVDRMESKMKKPSPLLSTIILIIQILAIVLVI